MTFPGGPAFEKSSRLGVYFGSFGREIRNVRGCAHQFDCAYTSKARSFEYTSLHMNKAAMCRHLRRCAVLDPFSLGRESRSGGPFAFLLTLRDGRDTIWLS
jgi:hypothetical protein